MMTPKFVLYYNDRYDEQHWTVWSTSDAESFIPWAMAQARQAGHARFKVTREMVA